MFTFILFGLWLGLIVILMLCRKPIKAFIQGFLPGIALKIFLILLPTILMIMSKFEGFLSISRLERRSASRYYLFNFFNVFLASVVTGTVLEQLDTFLKQSVNKYVLIFFYQQNHTLLVNIRFYVDYFLIISGSLR